MTLPLRATHPCRVCVVGETLLAETISGETAVGMLPSLHALARVETSRNCYAAAAKDHYGYLYVYCDLDLSRVEAGIGKPSHHEATRYGATLNLRTSKNASEVRVSIMNYQNHDFCRFLLQSPI